jgi:hypothetical protein
MIARLIGTIGSTHGVRFKASPPMNTSAMIASGPCPSNNPAGLIPASAFDTKVRNSSRSMYAPVPRTSN